MHLRATAAAAAALLCTALPARAQEPAPAADTLPRTSLREGAWSLSFLPPGYGNVGGNAELGAWKMVGPRTNLGVGLSVRVNENESGSGDVEATDGRTNFGVSVNVKRYTIEPREVTPFLFGGANIGYSSVEQEGVDGAEQSATGLHGGVRAAVGLEWFPVRRVSLAGYTGIALGVTRFDSEQSLAGGPQTDGNADSLFFGTFTSALSLQIYF